MTTELAKYRDFIAASRGYRLLFGNVPEGSFSQSRDNGFLSNTTKSKAVRGAQEFSWRLSDLAMAWNGEGFPVQASPGPHLFGAEEKTEKIFSETGFWFHTGKKDRGRK